MENCLLLWIAHAQRVGTDGVQLIGVSHLVRSSQLRCGRPERIDKMESLQTKNFKSETTFRALIVFLFAFINVIPQVGLFFTLCDYCVSGHYHH